MDRYLLDTHTAIWYFNGDKALSQTAREIILKLSNQVHLSIISAWELAIKINLKKLEFKGQVARFVSFAETYSFTILPIKASHLTILESLPLIHRDPFDRLLIATAISEQMTFISA
ncbi:MAG: type II toxin-antitoxin system VapC family toxin, partial [Brevinematales bacterium]|nr:type II toxin-antitoxin system VapC family toxin [Brevinematales bacterium]